MIVDKKVLNRREFLKLLGIAFCGSLTTSLDNSQMVSSAGAVPNLRFERQNIQSGTTLPNIIVLLLDALSARHLSLYNYHRKTSPNFERFARRAIVYNNHYSPANFTSPSTASCLTGCYPWTHRALHLFGLVRNEFVQSNLFRFLSPVYYQAAFTQNKLADALLYQLGETLDAHYRPDMFCIAGSALYPNLRKDEALNALYAYDQFQYINKKPAGSLFLALLRDLNTQIKYRLQLQKYVSIYPQANLVELDSPDTVPNLPSLTNADVYFTLDQLFEGVTGMLDEVAASAAKVAKPFLAYIHLLPPHAPYVPSTRFRDSFNDGWAPKPKPETPLSDSHISQKKLDIKRQRYDEFIADMDFEFGRLLDHLEQSGRLDDSILIVTSDHGETFERGEEAHSTPTLYEQLIRIPLLISVPGQSSRYDISTLTSTVDIVPSLLKIAGISVPGDARLEGRVLPGFENWPLASDSLLNLKHADDRSLFVVEAQSCPLNQRIQGDMASTAVVNGRYKLVHYTHYRQVRDLYEFYDLQNDPEELENIYKTNPLARDYQAELEKALRQADNRLFGKR